MTEMERSKSEEKDEEKDENKDEDKDEEKDEDKDENKDENKDMCVDSDNDMAVKLQKLSSSNKQNNKRKLRKQSIVIKEKEEGKESIRYKLKEKII